MSSERSAAEGAYVWVWLPGRTEPVVAGYLATEGRNLVFNYGRSYLQRPDRIALSPRELPLREGRLPLLDGLTIPGCLRDAAPDAWGRRVIINRRMGRAGRDVDPAAFSELDYLLESGSDRIGFLDFQSSPSEYVPRGDGGSPLEELQEASARIEAGVPLSGGLAEALLHGSSIGGARPKAMITDGDRKWIAKFSSTGDTYNVVKGEFIAMRLASLIGLDVAPVRLVRVHGRDVLLVERFDRARSDGGWTRRGLASALTLLELDEMLARYASYEALAEKIRAGFAEPRAALRELFLRLVVNVLTGNTDDHARNHAALWNGREYRLAPAYDICPQARTGGEATQAMLITGEDRRSRIATCLAAAGNFLLSPDEALTLVEGALQTVIDRWTDVCDEAALSEVDRRFFWRRQFLNPYAFEELEGRAAALRARA